MLYAGKKTTGVERDKKRAAVQEREKDTNKQHNTTHLHF